MWPGEVGVWKSTAPILFPFCGFFKEDTYEFRGKEYHLKGNGFANIKEFEVNLISNTKAEFSLLPDEETVNGFPFDFPFKVVFELVGNRLKTDYVITNNGDDTTLCVQSCPFQQNLFRLKRMLLLCLMVLQKPE